jgi:hypothetical protein
VQPLLSVCGDGATGGSDFLVVASDVIYPAGDVNDYVDGFYLPFERYKPPIYAIPGNHDWYDGLNGFMFHFCGAQPLPPTSYRAGSYTFVERMARRLWRKAARPDTAELLRQRSRRHDEAERRWEPSQPAPYFAIEAGPLLVVCIDTGITGALDRSRATGCGASRSRNGRSCSSPASRSTSTASTTPAPIVWGDKDDEDLEKETVGHRTVDDIVRNPDHGYVAVIGGDIHNYQRYSVTVRDPGKGEETGAPRRIEYITAGGGGAFLSATHAIGPVDLSPTGRGTRPPLTVDHVTEDDFRCYPLRGDSLARFTRRAMHGLYLIVLVSAALLAAGVVALVRWLHDDPVESLPGADATWLQVAAVVVVTVLLVPLAYGLGAAFRWVCRGISLRPPRGYRTFFVVSTTLAATSAVLALTAELLAADVWRWVWVVSATTAGILVVPGALLLLGYLTREIGPTFTRTMVPALALSRRRGRCSATTSCAATPGRHPVAMWLAISLAVLAALVLAIDALTRRRRGLLTFCWSFLPLAALALTLWLLHRRVDDFPVFEVLLPIVFTLGLLLAAVVVLWCWRVLLAAMLLCRPAKDLDPDQAVRYVADAHGTKVERGERRVREGRPADAGPRERALPDPGPEVEDLRARGGDPPAVLQELPDGRRERRGDDDHRLRRDRLPRPRAQPLGRGLRQDRPDGAGSGTAAADRGARHRGDGDRRPPSRG